MIGVALLYLLLHKSSLHGCWCCQKYSNVNSNVFVCREKMIVNIVRFIISRGSKNLARQPFFLVWGDLGIWRPCLARHLEPDSWVQILNIFDYDCVPGKKWSYYWSINIYHEVTFSEQTITMKWVLAEKKQKSSTIQLWCCLTGLQLALWFNAPLICSPSWIPGFMLWWWCNPAGFWGQSTFLCQSVYLCVRCLCLYFCIDFLCFFLRVGCFWSCIEILESRSTECSSQGNLDEPTCLTFLRLVFPNHDHMSLLHIAVHVSLLMRILTG